MTLALYAHPFSSYCWKVQAALYEAGTAFEYRSLDDPRHATDFAALSPLKKMPILLDGDRVVFESSVIIEHLDLEHPGPARMIPSDAREALVVRRLDRLFDNYVMSPMQKIVLDHIRAPDQRDPAGRADAQALLDVAYPLLDRELAGREWAAGAAFGLADCAAAPALFYADWVRPIPDACATLRAYRARVLARPSVARCVELARPYRHLFPPGAPDRD